MKKRCLLGAVACMAGLGLILGPTERAAAYDGPVEKKTFSLPSYTTSAGKQIPNVRAGYESYGTLNAAKDNAILVTHFFSGNSHAAGRYKPGDAAPGYWDAIIGAGKPIDTDKFFVISVDSLVNLSPNDPNTVTTGPATVDPATGKPYGMRFPIVGIRDFVNVQKAVLESLGIVRLHAVVGASMGALQAFEWAAVFPDMVDRIVPVIGGAEIDAYGIGTLDLWAAPIRLDPNWKGGDYFGGPAPDAGLAVALEAVTLSSRAPGWAATQFGRKWAAADKDPAQDWSNRYLIADSLAKAGEARAKTADADSFLYLVRANQLFLAGDKASLEEGLAGVKANVLLIPASSDRLLPPYLAEEARRILEKQGRHVEYVEIAGDGGHLDGVLNVARAGAPMKRFLEQ